MSDARSLEPTTLSTAAVATAGRQRAQGRGIRLLLIYGAMLALIAFWPVPVDRGAAGLLRTITRTVPWLTYGVIETTANVLLFVPLGMLLALALPLHRGLVVPIALATTLVIESGQALLLTQRTPSLRDIVANVIGAMVGLAVVHVVQWRSRRE